MLLLSFEWQIHTQYHCFVLVIHKQYSGEIVIVLVDTALVSLWYATNVNKIKQSD